MIGKGTAAGARPTAARRRWLFVFVLPGLWVLGVLAWDVLSPSGAQAVQFLAVAPAIACAGTGRRRCLGLGGACVLFALVPLVPLGPVSGGELISRLGACCAILAVVGAGYLAMARRRRLTAELARAREVAATAQEALLCSPPSRLDGLALAAGHLSASEGALIGGDLYAALATPYGVRVVMGDVRGHGLAALATVAAMLGSFREAAHYEAELGDVLRRLERALGRHLRERARAEPAPGRGGEADHMAAEEFVTVLLLEVRADGEVAALNCGHPWPYRLHARPGGGGRVTVETMGETMPPLGMFPLPADLTVGHGAPLPTGDALVLHTDGVEDARDGSGAFFPLGPALVRAARSAPIVPAEVIAGVRAALLRHTGGRLSDDAALLVVRNDRQRVPTGSGVVHLAGSGRCGN
ncbi:PP2C family protein-serine/threonine phosphatase [Streptomyces sp. NPDC057654]|uniref:PP2C family protein-serine/threonine phosphatase n=1 Tax=Streptomyces sp. NPDC057654 TaxID=3346196 RepID=UPI0036AD896D